MNVNGTYVVNVTMATHSKSLSTWQARGGVASPCIGRPIKIIRTGIKCLPPLSACGKLAQALGVAKRARRVPSSYALPWRTLNSRLDVSR